MQNEDDKKAYGMLIESVLFNNVCRYICPYCHSVVVNGWPDGQMDVNTDRETELKMYL